MTDPRLEADRVLALVLISCLAGFSVSQHDRLSKTQRLTLKNAEQALDMFLSDTIEEA